MAYALMEIRKQHIDSLRKTIEDAPYVYLMNVMNPQRFIIFVQHQSATI